MSGLIEERLGSSQGTATKLEQRYAELVRQYLASLRDKVNAGTSSLQDRQILDTLAKAYGIEDAGTPTERTPALPATVRDRVEVPRALVGSYLASAVNAFRSWWRLP